MAWLAGLEVRDGPVYLAIVRALEAAVRTGALHPGDRLPPQRAVAERLGIDLTTVTRAYSAARERGLVEGTVGRGTFIRARHAEDDAGVVDLSMNLPPPPQGLSLGRLLGDTTADILARTHPATLMAYHPGFGTLGQRAAGAHWLRPTLGEVAADRLLVSPGAQSALAAVLATICKPGDTVLAEPLTYPGFLAAARRQGLRLVACPADTEGLVPDALERLWAQHRPRAVYLVPTMQNPVATTLGQARRREVARIVTAAGGWIIEDDPYSRLMEAPPQAVAAFAPDRSFHLATLSKCLSPGLRIAYLACPASQAETVAEALRATALMPAPLMAAIATRWIVEGEADRLLAAVRDEARARRALAGAALPLAQGHADSIHVWLPLPAGRSPERLRLAAKERGVSLVTAEAFAVEADHHNGVRISLGGASRRGVLETALRALAALLAEEGPATPRLIV